MGGDAYTQGNTRNLNRIFVSVLSVIFLVALVGVPLYFYLRTNQSVQTPCHEGLTVPLLNPIFHPNGSVVDGDDFYPSGYHFTTNGTTHGCLCVLKPCIRKCCAKDEYYVKVPRSASRCKKTPGPSPFENFSLPVHKTPGERVDVDRDHFRILYGDVCRHGKFLLTPEESSNDKNGLLTDGTFRIIDEGRYLDVSSYCFDSMNGDEEIRAFMCFPDPAVDDETKVQLLLYPIAMMVSIPFLMATIVVYSILPGLRNLHGKSLICQCTCLLISNLGLAIINLEGSTIHNFWCVFFAFMVQFTFLGSFFWLNVMSFDIWWSFSGLRPAKWGLKATEHKRFLLYSLYAWGMPLGIVATSAGMDMIPGIPDSFIKPGFGRLKCWFAGVTHCHQEGRLNQQHELKDINNWYFIIDDWTGTFLYFYLPSGIVLILNTAMFVTTAMNLQSYTKNNHDTVRFRLYLRLFIIMGLNWSLELLSFFVGGPKSIWFVTDLTNILQGVVIFFFFVFKRDILQKLNKKLCPNWNLTRGTSSEYSKSLSSSISQTKTEVDILALKSLDDSNEEKHEDTQPRVT